MKGDYAFVRISSGFEGSLEGFWENFLTFNDLGLKF